MAFLLSDYQRAFDQAAEAVQVAYRAQLPLYEAAQQAEHLRRVLRPSVVRQLVDAHAAAEQAFVATQALERLVRFEPAKVSMPISRAESHQARLERRLAEHDAQIGELGRQLGVLQGEATIVRQQVLGGDDGGGDVSAN